MPSSNEVLDEGAVDAEQSRSRSEKRRIERQLSPLLSGKLPLRPDPATDADTEPEGNGTVARERGPMNAPSDRQPRTLASSAPAPAPAPPCRAFSRRMHRSRAEGERAAGGALSGLGSLGGGLTWREHRSVVRAAIEILRPRMGSGALSSVVQYE